MWLGQRRADFQVSHKKIAGREGQSGRLATVEIDRACPKRGFLKSGQNARRLQAPDTATSCGQSGVFF